MIAVSCTPSLMDLIDLGSRIAGCIMLNDGVARPPGTPSTGILIVICPEFVDAPLFTYRGTVAVGPGKVQLGRHRPGAG